VTSEPIKEPAFDVCYGGDSLELRCFTVNQPGKGDYKRVLDLKYDFILDIDDFAELSKHHKELHQIIKELEDE
jgi:hypothetical protein